MSKNECLGRGFEPLIMYKIPLNYEMRQNASEKCNIFCS